MYSSCNTLDPLNTCLEDLGNISGFFSWTSKYIIHKYLTLRLVGLYFSVIIFFEIVTNYIRLYYPNDNSLYSKLSIKQPNSIFILVIKEWSNIIWDKLILSIILWVYMFYLDSSLPNRIMVLLGDFSLKKCYHQNIGKITIFKW